MLNEFTGIASVSVVWLCIIEIDPVEEKYILRSAPVAMSLDPKTPSRVEEANEEHLPTPISTLRHVRSILSQPVVAAFIAGGVAGAVSRTVVSPLERLKILFQIQSGGKNEYNQSVMKGLLKMWRDEGWRGFMRGNGTNCIRIVPYSAVQFGSYNFYKRVGFLSHCCYFSATYSLRQVIEQSLIILWWSSLSSLLLVPSSPR